MCTNAYKGGGGLTNEVCMQSKNLSAFCIHPAISSFVKVPLQTFNYCSTYSVGITSSTGVSIIWPAGQICQCGPPRNFE